MSSNSFGKLFRITTFGESHGKGIGVVIDGCPSLIAISKEEIEADLMRRRPGFSLYTSPRKEVDTVEILSGIYEGKTTGAPIALWIANQDVQSSPYKPLENLYRPSHANFTYLHKYGIFDPRGGSRASARETVARVAAGVIAKKLLLLSDIQVIAYLQQVGPIECLEEPEFASLKMAVDQSTLFCPDPMKEKQIQRYLSEILEEGDSIGGIVKLVAKVPLGLGDPLYEKLEARLALAMLSIPASKGFEIGEGFSSVFMKGSQHNDPYGVDETGNVRPQTNHAGGVLAGISTGELVTCRTVFKPTSTIRKAQQSVLIQEKREHTFDLPEKHRHDPCVAIRAVPVVEAMGALCLADACLQSSLARFRETI